MKMNLSINTDKLERHAPRIIALGLLAGCLLWLLTGCQHEAIAKSGPTPAGEYTLVTLDGQAVPCTIHHEGTTMEIHSGSITFTTNGLATSRMVISAGNNKEAVCTRQAAFDQSGTSLALRWKNAGRTKGNLAGNTFTMNNEGMTLVYQK